MDLARVQDLEGSILRWVQAGVPRVVCIFDPEVDSIVCSGGRALTIGHDQCRLSLQRVGQTRRHRLCVSSLNSPTKVFRETRAGWFAVQHVASHISAIVTAEARTRQQQRLERQRLTAAGHEVKRLASKNPALGSQEFELLVSRDRPGTIDVVIHGLREETVLKLIDALRDLGVISQRSSAHKDLWAQLKEEPR